MVFLVHIGLSGLPRSELGDLCFQFSARRDQLFRVDLGGQRAPCLAPKEEGDAFVIGTTRVRQANQYSVAIEPDFPGGELDCSARLQPAQRRAG